MALHLTEGQRRFRDELARKTGLNPAVVSAWMYAEENGSAAQSRERSGNYNWLNIGWTDRGPHPSTKSSVWSTPESAAKVTAKWMRGRGPVAKSYGRPAQGIMRILSTVGQGSGAQVQALANSGWATAPNYGSVIGSLVKQFGDVKVQDAPAGGTGWQDGHWNTKPGVDNSPLRQQILQQYVLGQVGGPLQLAVALKDAQDTPAAKTYTPGQETRVPARSGGGYPGKKGRIQITGPNPGRIRPEVKQFMRQIAGVAGMPVVGSDGTGHSKYTTNGNVSEHYTGSASDIPAVGAKLMRLGRAALVAAGMNPKKARNAPGGLYNLYRNGVRYQIIFGINDPARGGNHTDHLHVGVSHQSGSSAGR